MFVHVSRVLGLVCLVVAGAGCDANAEEASSSNESDVVAGGVTRSAASGIAMDVAKEYATAETGVGSVDSCDVEREDAKELVFVCAGTTEVLVFGGHRAEKSFECTIPFAVKRAGSKIGYVRGAEDCR